MENILDYTKLEVFNEFFDAFREYYPGDKGTLKNYHSRFLKFVLFLKEKRSITPLEADSEDLAAYHLFLKSKESRISPQIVSLYLNSLNSLYAFLIRKGLYAGENPFKTYKENLNDVEIRIEKNLSRRLGIRVAQKDKFTDEEVARLLDAIPKVTRNPYLALAIDIAVNTGIREDGIGKLTLDKIKKDETTGKFYIQLTKGMNEEENDTKTHSQKVPFPPTLFERIEKFLEERDIKKAKRGKIIPEELKNHLFLSNQLGPLTGAEISARFRQLILQVIPKEEIEKRKLSFHSLRKTFATRMLKDFPLHTVSKMLGHSKITTTIHYLKLNEQEVLTEYAEKAKEKDLDFITGLETKKKSEKIQVAEKDIIEQQKAIDLEIDKVTEALLSVPEQPEQYEIRLKQLIEERSDLRSQLMSPREQQLYEEVKNLQRQNARLQEELRFANERQKELPNFKFYERKTKKNLKAQMKERAISLKEEGLGYGKIADIVNNEFNTKFTRQAIKYWIVKRQSQE